METEITIRGAREHNLRNVSLSIPKNKLVVFTGVSGSGKSSLAFDTLYAEGQRRYVESLSSYARQFLGQMNKPDVDAITGLSPAISIEQKKSSHNPRSTVGTVTEIYDHYRLLFARIGTPHCPKCDKPIEPQSAEFIVNQLLATSEKNVQVLAPAVRQKKGTYAHLFEKYRKEGFSRLRVDKKTYKVYDEPPKLEKYVRHDVEVVVDRVALKKENRTRLTQALEQALHLGQGLVLAVFDKREELFSSKGACKRHPEVRIEELQPRMFSFNSPFGACKDCHGLGVLQEFDPGKIIPDESKSIQDGAIAPWKSYGEGWRYGVLRSYAEHEDIPLDEPFKNLPKAQRNLVFYGSSTRHKIKLSSRDGSSTYAFESDFEGIIPQLKRLYHQTQSDYRRREMEKYMTTRTCPACNGKRLAPVPLAVRINGENIVSLTEKSISESVRYFKKLPKTLSKNQLTIARLVLKEINDRLKFLHDVGLDYLTLDRRAGTLSGGEGQRIRLATQIGSNLTGVLYILDEPSIGLHQRDNRRLISTLKSLRDLGNTLVVVEHDERTILEADHVVDIGPGAGIHGGKIVSQGTPTKLKRATTLTGQYLSGKKSIPLPKWGRRTPRSFLRIFGVKTNNLKDLEVGIPLGTFCCITGVSGSGKSSLITDTLYPALTNIVYRSKHKAGPHKRIIGSGVIDKVINIDQSPIGRTPRSNPVTYTGAFAHIRELFAKTKEARARGYKPGRFSFNVKTGRCAACEGNGLIKIEMNFLPDVYVECEQCRGKRYSRETLDIYFKGKNIADVLDMTVEEAKHFFQNQPALFRKLHTLERVGLGYIRLGQSATTLSGGEAQRIKLTSELARAQTGRTLYFLDEPTTGLHFDDVKKLLDVLQSLVEKGNTVVVIEHNLDVIKSADQIIDLGPEGGEKGGKVVAAGTPEQVAKHPRSYTGKYLKKMLVPR